MPYKDKKKQREAVRQASRKHRQKKKQEALSFERELQKIDREIAKEFRRLFIEKKRRKRKK